MASLSLSLTHCSFGVTEVDGEFDDGMSYGCGICVHADFLYRSCNYLCVFMTLLGTYPGRVMLSIYLFPSGRTTDCSQPA